MKVCQGPDTESVPRYPWYCFDILYEQDNLLIFSLYPSLDRAAGGGAAARRVPADVPPHIQQLLEQQDRQQALERASPMRRPICRRMLVPQGSEPGEGSGNVYIIPGVIVVVLHLSHVVMGGCSTVSVDQSPCVNCLVCKIFSQCCPSDMIQW